VRPDVSALRPVTEHVPAGRPSLLDLDWIDDEEPSVLLVGDGHAMQAALAAALQRHGVPVEITRSDAVVETLVAATPKLILLMGDAAHDGGSQVLRRMRGIELGATAPVAVLLEKNDLDGLLSALRNGAAAAIPHSASVDAIAERVSTLARSKRGQYGQAAWIGETSLKDLLDALGKRVFTSVIPGSSIGDAVASNWDALRLVLGDGPVVAKLLDDFVASLRSGLIKADFQKEVGPSELLGEQAVAEAKSAAEISGMRVLLADADSLRADSVAQALRARAASVVVTGFDPSDERFHRLRQFDPMVLLIRSSDLKKGGQALVDRAHRDSRLRWASIMSSDWEEAHWPANRSTDEMIGRLAALAEPDRTLRSRAQEGPRFDTRLEVIGPARTLRTLAGSQHPVRMKVQNPKVSVSVDLSEGLVVGASAQVHAEETSRLEGSAALAALLSLRSGKLEIERVDEAVVVNIMSTVESAINMAEAEEAPLSRPSVFSSVVEATELAPSVVPAGQPAALAPAAQRRMPGYKMLAVVCLGAGALVMGAVAALVGLRSRAHAPESAPSAAVRKPPPPAGSASATILERAAKGDKNAMSVIEQRAAERRSLEEALALTKGRVAEKAVEIEALRVAVSKNPALLNDAKTVRRLIGLTRDPSAPPEVLAAIASLPGPASADIIYQVWVGTSERTLATRLAQDLANSEVIRKKASPALAVALDLRKADTCGKANALLPAAIDHGDDRSLRPLGSMLRRTGCGPYKAQDCYACLRNGKDLSLAIATVRRRRSPRF
jgi:DNA-binding NarL/FixJ family response regulator